MMILGLPSLAGVSLEGHKGVQFPSMIVDNGLEVLEVLEALQTRGETPINNSLATDLGDKSDGRKMDGCDMRMRSLQELDF